MTGDMMNLRSLVEKSADADLLREMIGFAAEKLMALEVGANTDLGLASILHYHMSILAGYQPTATAGSTARFKPFTWVKPYLQTKTGY